jgi:hypothetical protein
VSDYGLDEPDYLAGAEVFLFATASRSPHVFTQVFYPTGTRDFFLGVKRPDRKVDHSTRSSAQVKLREASPQFLYDFVALCLSNSTLS